MPHHGDFQLPGLENHPRGNQALIGSIAVAYSALANPRRLEDPLYIFWNSVMHYLIHDLQPEVSLCPQYKVYRDPKNRPRPDTSTDTTPGSNAQGLIPDFTLLGIYFADRTTRRLLQHVDYPISFGDWLHAQVVITKPFCLFEIKRMASRRCKTLAKFQQDLATWTDLARQDAEAQAQLTFIEPAYNVDSLILIAASGEWWRFRFVHRSEFIEEDTDNILSDIDEYKEAEEEEEEHEAHEEEKAVEQQDGEEVDEEDVKSWRFTELQPHLMEYFQQNVEDAIPEKGIWSGYILFGTPSSNQRWYLVHEELCRMKESLEKDALAKVASLPQPELYESWDSDDELLLKEGSRVQEY